ncbi:MAG TPA: cobalamin ABC transporter substrate-binding protein [Polyangiaceae bacterium]|jgi:hypothetical protein|nr:cobalamin ABC transporter substrate-binding protein [Polyangiaceae bacterium]
MAVTLPRRALLLMALATACSKKKSKSPAVEMGPWKAEMRDMFDDRIHPGAVGLAMDAGAPASDPLLRMRAQAAEVVARMRVQTLTRDTVGARITYTLSLQVGQPPLMPAKLEQRVIEVSIGPESDTFGLVQSLEGQLRGRTFIGFVRRFTGKDGPELHWHLTADTNDVAQVIQEVALLEEMAAK